VLKDILLVILSVIIWSTQITPLQIFGYAIALGGLVWYKMAGAKPQQSPTDDDKSEKPPMNRRRKVRWILIGGILLLIFGFLVLEHKRYLQFQAQAPQQKTGIAGVLGPMMGGKKEKVQPQSWW
jgi:hypothetical protein